MARTDTLGNFLTDVAEAIRTKEGTTETILASEFDTRITNLSGGGTGELKKLPVYFSGWDGIGSSNTANTVSLNYYPGNIYRHAGSEVTKIIVAWFVRSDYTISDNVTVIGETDWFTVDNVSQQIGVGYMDFDYNNTSTITVTLTTSEPGRMELMVFPLVNAGVPIVVNNDMGEGQNETKQSLDFTTDDNFNLYVFTQVYKATLSSTSTFPSMIFTRLACFVFNESGEQNISWTGNSYNKMIHLQVPYKKKQ